MSIRILCILIILTLKGSRTVRAQGGWYKSSNGLLYKLFPDSKTWYASKMDCEQRGGRLASTAFHKDSRTRSEIYRYVNGVSVWIGLHDVNRDPAEWIWSDGVRFNAITAKNLWYLLWRVNEPNNAGGDEHCAELMSSHKLNDFGCSEKIPRLCEAEPSSRNRALFKADMEKIRNLTQLEPNHENVMKVSKTLNNLLNIPEKYFAENSNISAEIVTDVANFLSQYDASTSKDFSSEDKNVEINITRLTPNGAYVIEASGNAEALSRIQITLESNLLQEALTRQANENHLQVASVMYRKTNLFQIDEEKYTHTISQKDSDSVDQTFRSKNLTKPMFGEYPELELVPVVLTEVGTVDIKDVIVQDFPYPVRFSANVPDKPTSDVANTPTLKNKKAIQKTICAFWNTSQRDWSTKGCKKLPGEKDAAGETTVSCECDHMTAFAVVVRTTYIFAPKYMTIITTVFCTFSTICLIATAITILAFRELRQKSDKQIILHICISLIALNLVFIVGIDRNEEDKNVIKRQRLCLASSVSLHYFLLTAWGWMLVEAIFLFLSIALPLRSRGFRERVVSIATGFAYVIPALLVGLVAGLSDDYLSDKYCWLKQDILMYSVLIPVACVLGINFIVVLAAPVFIACGSEVARDQTAAFWRNGFSRLGCVKAIQTVRRTLSMSFILGIPWVFGFLMLLSQDETSKDVFAWLFSVFNTLQGTLIFIFFCALPPNVRGLWLRAVEKRLMFPLRRALSDRKKRVEMKERKEIQTCNITIPNDDTVSTKVSSLNTPPRSKNMTFSDEAVRKPFRSGWV